jgi:cytochrome c
MGLRHSTIVALAGLAWLGGVQAAGDAQRGEQVYESRCGGCHAVESDRVGPRHAGVFGRRAGSVKGFDYSDALAKSRVVWDEATLTRWLADPEAVIPGQRMGYRLGDAAARADVVAYLRTLKP